jgi:hypothetical protein
MSGMIVMSPLAPAIVSAGGRCARIGARLSIATINAVGAVVSRRMRYAPYALDSGLARSFHGDRGAGGQRCRGRYFGNPACQLDTTFNRIDPSPIEANSNTTKRWPSAVTSKDPAVAV